MVQIVEVGPRDGLQNEPTPIPTEAKEAFVRDLAAAGLVRIEATSFVHPKWVPQLADADDLLARLRHNPPEATLSALVPNPKGLDRAKSACLQAIALFTAASEEFTRRNINMTIDESLQAAKTVVEELKQKQTLQSINSETHLQVHIRAYVSTIVQCPFSGPVPPAKVAQVTQSLLHLGADEVSLGDTTGVAVPKDIQAVAQAVEAIAPKDKIAWHFHDTRGTAIANTAAMLERGYTIFDSSAAGLGGCPYAPGAGGNLATEDLVYFLEKSGVPTGVDLSKLAQASLPLLKILDRTPTARAQLATLATLASPATTRPR